MTTLAGALLDPDEVVGTGDYASVSAGIELGVLTPSRSHHDERYVTTDGENFSNGAQTLLLRWVAQPSSGGATTNRLLPGQAMDMTAAARESFNALARRLEADTSHLSVIRRARDHPVFEYLLRSHPASVALALRRLNGENRPLWLLFLDRAEGDAGPSELPASIDEAARAWRRWGRDHGRI